jgi:hypothetical protein
MTGQVKEEVLTRFAELGLRVNGGRVSIQPALLRTREFCAAATSLCYLDVDNAWQTLSLPASSLGFTWCQVPFVYVLDDNAPHGVMVEFDDGEHSHFTDLSLPASLSRDLFERNGRVRQITVTIGTSRLFGD